MSNIVLYLFDNPFVVDKVLLGHAGDFVRNSYKIIDVRQFSLAEYHIKSISMLFILDLNNTQHSEGKSQAEIDTLLTHSRCIRVTVQT